MTNTPVPGSGPGPFEHVVVLMLENRSFDNLLGYLYPKGVPQDAPLGRQFDGVAGKDLWNPFPAGSPNPPPDGHKVPVAPVGAGGYFTPYPDPGETYEHVNTQLWGRIDGGRKPPWNLPPDQPLPPPPMCGFVTDYIENWNQVEEKGKHPSYEQYAQILQCFTPEQVPVLSTLAQEFAVFDHWFCAVPSQTWCNRAFWNAGTSWGKVVNGPSVSWLENSAGTTIFNQIHDSGTPLDWRIYSANPFVSLSTLIHTRALEDFHLGSADRIVGIDRFFADCKAGRLPAYSFLEPRFITPHNDMHPSSAHSLLYGKAHVGSVLLGELLIWQVYEAVRTSATAGGSHAGNTLLVITYDEHGGCYDHVAPPMHVTPPDLKGCELQDGFDFTRLGVRVPMVMVGAGIARHTVVNTPMHHGSFLKTVGGHWNRRYPGKFPPLTARIADAPAFDEVFTAKSPRPASDWPVIPKPQVPSEFWDTDFSALPLGHLERSFVDAVNFLHLHRALPAAAAKGPPPPAHPTTVGHALEHLSRVQGLLPEQPHRRPADA